MKAPLQIKIKLALLVGDLLLLALCLASATYIRLDEIQSLYGQYGTAAALCLMIYPL